MPIHLLIDPAGSGGIHRILDIFKRFTPTEHQSTARLIVPSVSRVIRLRKLLLADPGFPGIFGDPICTLTRFASEVCPDASELVTDAQRQLILREMVQSAPVGCFDEVRRTPGFPPELAGAIRMLSESGMTANDLSRGVDDCRGSLREYAVRRLLSLADLCRAYENALRERNLAEPEGLIRHAVEALSADPSPLQALKCVMIDGFFDFSPAQRELIRLIGEHCPEVIVTAEDGAQFPDAFQEPLHQAPVHPARHLFIAADPRMEVEMTAREIRRLVREGFRHSDIAIVIRSMRDHRRISGIMKEYRIPVSDEIHLLSQSALAQRVLDHDEDLGSVQALLRETPLPDDEDQLREHCAAWKSILRIMDGIPADGQVFRDLLRSGTYRLPGELPGGVSLTTAGALDGRKYRAVFVHDFADGVFPRRVDDDPFISDQERRILNAYLPHPLPTIADAESRERRLFQRAVGSAQDRLYLCRTTHDEPSPYLEDMSAIDCTALSPGDILPPIAQAETPRELVARAILDLCTSVEPIAAETYNRLLDAGLVGADTFARLGKDYAEFIPAHLRLLAEESGEE